MTKLPHDTRVAVEDKLMAVELPEKPLRPDRSQPAQYTGQFERRDTIDSEHVQWLDVVAEHQWPTLGRTPPQALLSERNLPILKVHTDVGIKQSKPINGRKRRSGRNARNVIDRSDELPRAIGLSRSRWGVLVFSSHVADPTARCGPSGNAIDGVEPFLIRPAKVINHRLPEVIAIGEWLSRDSCNSRIDRFDASAKSSVATFSFELLAEFRFEQAINLVCLRPAVALCAHRLRGFLQEANALIPSPGLHPCESTVDQAHGCEPVKRRIDP